MGSDRWRPCALTDGGRALQQMQAVCSQILSETVAARATGASCSSTQPARPVHPFPAHAHRKEKQAGRHRAHTEGCVAMALTACAPRCCRGRSRAPASPSMQPLLPRYRTVEALPTHFKPLRGHGCVFARGSSKREPCAHWVTEEQWRVRGAATAT